MLIGNFGFRGNVFPFVGMDASLRGQSRELDKKTGISKMDAG